MWPTSRKASPTDERDNKLTEESLQRGVLIPACPDSPSYQVQQIYRCVFYQVHLQLSFTPAPPELHIPILQLVFVLSFTHTHELRIFATEGPSCTDADLLAAASVRGRRVAMPPRQFISAPHCSRVHEHTHTSRQTHTTKPCSCEPRIPRWITASNVSSITPRPPCLRRTTRLRHRVDSAVGLP